MEYCVVVSQPKYYFVQPLSRLLISVEEARGSSRHAIIYRVSKRDVERCIVTDGFSPEILFHAYSSGND